MATNRVTEPRAIVGPYDIRSGYNAGSSDIAKGYILKDDPSAVGGVALATANTDTLVGVSTEVIEAGMHRSYQIRNKVGVYAGATVAKGDLLTTDATSRAVKASAGSASSQQNMLGRAATAGIVGDWIEVELFNQVTAFVTSPIVADTAAIKAIAAASRWDGLEVVRLSDYSTWIFNAASVSVDATENLILSPTAGTGKWVRKAQQFHLSLPFTYATADATVLFTVPAGMKIEIDRAYWEVTADMTGGSSSAIGISSDLAPHETKGDILGGSGGDVAATMTASLAPNAVTVGTSFTATPKMVVLTAGKVVRFDRITSAYTAGTGNVHLDCRMVS